MNMAGIQVKVLYSFEAQPGSGEISVTEGEVLTVTRQDVGEGWWEGTNSRSTTGLFPAAYVEEIASAPPSMPPPPLPSTYANTGDITDDLTHNSWAQTQQQQAHIGFKAPNQQASTENDDWDDDWDDDDSEPGTSHLNGASYLSVSTRRPVGTLSEMNFAGLGKLNVDEREKIYIDDSGSGPHWRHSGLTFSCSITSPKKGSKFHGMKSFIAYTITPTTTNHPVSRRYKHFDWLHDRLSVKFTMIPIPPLPEKQISGRFEDDLIEYRMTMLQSWIDRICRHPVLSQCDVLQHFLNAPNDEKTWKAGKRRAEADKLIGLNLYQAVQRPELLLDLVQTESKLEGYSRFFSQLDDSVKLMQNTCGDQTKKHQGAYKREYSKISHSFAKLARAFDVDPSNSAPQLAEAIQHVSEAYSDIGDIFDAEPKHDWEPLSNLLYEYKGVIDGFPSIITAAKGSISKRKQLEKDASEGKADHDQVPPLIHRSDTIVYGLHAEVANFQRERHHDFKRAMTHFVTEQINFYQKIADRLRSSLQHFNDI